MGTNKKINHSNNNNTAFVQRHNVLCGYRGAWHNDVNLYHVKSNTENSNDTVRELALEKYS